MKGTVPTAQLMKESCSNSSAHERELFKQLSSRERAVQTTQLTRESCSNRSALMKGAVPTVQSTKESCSSISAHERELFEQISSYERSCSNSSASIKGAFERLFRSAGLNFRAGAGAPLVFHLYRYRWKTTE